MTLPNLLHIMPWATSQNQEYCAANTTSAPCPALHSTSPRLFEVCPEDEQHQKCFAAFLNIGK